MKSVLISIRPKWVEKIASVEKTIEVRKTAPKEVPFKCYIYCTKSDENIYGDSNVFVTDSLKRLRKSHTMEDAFEKQSGLTLWNGKVIGEFVCDKAIKTCGWRLRGDTQQCAKRTTDEEAFPELACLTIDEIVKYAGSENREVCGLHISDLKIYDKPKELSEFYTIAESGSDCCCGCVWHETPLDEMPCRTCTAERNYLYRPTMSWQYVEELIK